ncbi:MAG TPA: DUF2079 domain-containing protein [Gaiellaceae bacterium]
MSGNSAAVIQPRLSSVWTRAKAVPRDASAASLAVYVAAAVYGVVFAVAATVYYLGFNEARLDLGDMVQAIWSTAHGHFLQFTTPNGLELSRLGAHADPFLVLLVPLWWIWPSPVGLLVAQALAVAAGAVPVYWLARKHLASGRAAAHMAIAYLLFPATQFNAFTPTSGVHAVSFAVPLLLFAIWYLDEDRLVPFSLVALLAMSTKEEIGAAVGLLGLWYAVRKRRWIVGLTVFVVGFVVTAVDFLFVIPHFASDAFQPFAARYAGVGGTPSGIAHEAVTHPLRLLEAMGSGHKAVYLALLIVPLLGLALLEPLLLLCAVPDLAINLLSSDSNQTTIQFQYTAGIVPFLFAAGIFGIRRLRRDADRTSMLVLVAVMLVAAYSPLFLSSHEIGSALRHDPTRAAKTTALRLVPSSASVSASNQLAGRLSARRHITIFPWRAHADWVVVDRSDPTYESRSRFLAAIRHVTTSGTWKRVFAAHGVEVFRRS